MSRLITSFSFAAILAMSVQASADALSIIHAGTLIVRADQPSQPEKTLLVRDGLIERIADGYLSAAELGVVEVDDLKTYDLKNRAVMPGFIDGHVHITSRAVMGSTSARRSLDMVQFSSADWLLMGVAHSRDTVEAGFTTVRDLSTRSTDAMKALKRGIKSGVFVGPRIISAGYGITPTGGHMDRSLGFRDDLRPGLITSGVCDGIDDCRRAVRKQVRAGAEAIKITATGGVLSNVAAGLGQQFTDEELKAIVDTAHNFGLKVTAHAHSNAGIQAALNAGVDSIEHGTFLDAQTLKLFEKYDAYLVPTLLAGEGVKLLAEKPGALSVASRVKARQAGNKMMESAQLAHQKGVKIAFGSDTGVTSHGENAREFDLLVEAGLTPQEALISGTIYAADNLGLLDQIGTLEPGKKADIIALVADPYEDISRVHQVKFVMVQGRLVKYEP